VSSPPRPWQRLRRGLEHDYRIAKVRSDIYADPRTGHEHPRLLIDMPDWVNIIALTPGNDIVLVRQFRFGTGESTLEIPGGLVDAGEDPAVAAVRELEEETGYVPGRVEALGSLKPNPALQGNTCYSFLARDCVQKHGGRPDEGEDLTVELHPYADVPRLVREGHITHAIIVAAFHLARLHADAAR
jgi:ADP-ribose pyrophosphatase